MSFKSNMTWSNYSHL